MDEDDLTYPYKRYYDELCSCHKNTTGHPRPLIPIPNLMKAAEKGCPICSVVKQGLLIALSRTIDTNYGVSFAVKPRGEFKLKYMRDGRWETEQKFEIYLGRGEITSTAFPLASNYKC
jgi:hypothetical protein